MIRPKSLSLRVVLCLTILGGALSGCPLGQDFLNKGDVALTRKHPGTYVPGSMLTATIEIAIKEGVEISAIALVETVPAGWTYVSVEGTGNTLPNVRPEEGAGGLLSFVWIQPPVFPCTFTYTLEAPLNTADTVTLSGHVEYRHGSGPAEHTGTLRSMLNAS